MSRGKMLKRSVEEGELASSPQEVLDWYGTETKKETSLKDELCASWMWVGYAGWGGLRWVLG